MKENKQNTPRVVRWWWVRWNKIIQEEAYGGILQAYGNCRIEQAVKEGIFEMTLE